MQNAAGRARDHLLQSGAQGRRTSSYAERGRGRRGLRFAWTPHSVLFGVSEPSAASLDVTTKVRGEASSRSQKVIHLIWIKHSKAALKKMVWRPNLAPLNIAAIGPGSEEFQASTGGGLEKERNK